MPQKTSDLLASLEPTIRSWIQSAITGTTTGANVGTHALNGPKHTGTLDQSQAPWAVTYTQLANHSGNPNAHHNQATSGDGISVSADQIVSLPSTVAGNGLTYAAGVLDVAVSGLGLSVAADVVTLTSSSDVSSGIERILASDVGGGLTLADLTATGSVDAPIFTYSGGITVNPTGDITLDPGGDDVLPGGSMQIDLGDYNRMWRTFFAAEMYVQTLVAQDVIATIGGRIMVSPTSKLIADLSSATPASTTIDLEHNNFAAGDFLLMQASPNNVPQIEVFKVTAGPTTITGGFRYTVTRNQDGTGQNNWYTGDAVASLGGAVGEGYIDLTATSTVLNHFGPTIATYVRTSTTNWDDLVPTTAQGNLESFVDYSTPEYGFALGNDLTLTPTTGFSGMTADRTDGIRLFNGEISLYTGSDLVLHITPSNGIDIQASGAGAGYETPAGITWYADLAGSTFLSGITYENGTGGYLSMYSTAYAKDAYIQMTAYRQSASGYRPGISMAHSSTTGSIQFQGDVFEFYRSSGSPTFRINAGGSLYTIWHAGNDGPGTGLDADTLDTYQASQFARLAGSPNFSTKVTLSYSAGTAMEFTAGYGILFNTGATAQIWKTGGTLRLLVDGGNIIQLSDNANSSNMYAVIGGSAALYSARLTVYGSIHSNAAVTSEAYFQLSTEAAPSAASGWGRIWFDGTNLRLTTAAGTYTINKS